MSYNSAISQEVNLWYSNQYFTDPVFSDVTGSGLTGTYDGEFVNLQYVNVHSTNQLGVYTSALGSGVDLGLRSPDMTMIGSIDTNPSPISADFGFDSTSRSYISMGDYFADYTGTYTPTLGTLRLRSYDDSDTFYLFAINSVEIVPEPATMALLGLGGLFVRRKKA